MKVTSENNFNGPNTITEFQLPRKMAFPTLPNELDVETSKFTTNILPPSKNISLKSFNKEKGIDYFVKHNSGRVSKAFFPLRIVLLVLGRSPFVAIKVKSTGITGDGGSLTYDHSFSSPLWLYFGLTSLVLMIVLILSTIGFVHEFLGWDFDVKRKWCPSDIDLFRSNLVPFVLFWSCLFHATVANVSFVLNRKRIAEFLNSWNMIVDVMNIKVPNSFRKFLVTSNLWFVGFLVTIFIFYFLEDIPTVRNGSALIGILVFQPFIEGLEYSNNSNGAWKIRAFGIVTLLYAIYASRALLFMFAFKSRLLRHGFKTWNERFKDEMKRFRNDERRGTHIEKVACEKLYRDHCLLVQMVKRTDQVFGAVLQSYYGSQILNMCFELYYLASPLAFGVENVDSNYEIVAATLLLLQNIYFFFTVSLDAAYVCEEASKGFEILRHHGFHPDQSSHKQYLMYSLQVSFSRRIVITGGKFFCLDRPFIVKVLSAVFTYFVIILQLGPALQDDKSNGNENPTNISTSPIKLKTEF